MKREPIGERLKRLRLERGLSQRDVSSPGVSYAYVSRVEAGARTPSVKAIRLLAEKLEVTAHYLEVGADEVVYVLVVPTLTDPGEVVGVMHDREQAVELAEWMSEQGHQMSVVEMPVDDEEALRLIKQRFVRREAEQSVR